MAKSGPDDLLILDRFCPLSDSFDILSICTHIPNRVEIRRDLFQSSHGNQLLTDKWTDGFHSITYALQHTVSRANNN